MSHKRAQEVPQSEGEGHGVFCHLNAQGRGGFGNPGLAQVTTPVYRKGSHSMISRMSSKYKAVSYCQQREKS